MAKAATDGRVTVVSAARRQAGSRAEGLLLRLPRSRTSPVPEGIQARMIATTRPTQPPELSPSAARHARDAVN